MKNSDTVEVRVSKVINASKWRILRLITKVQEFPEYMPSVKEVQVLEKNRNIMKTKWRIKVEKVPISWTEEDRFAFSEGRIYFRAIEGDLEEFRGSWSLEDHPEGTKVDVAVNFKVGIPAIKDFADTYVKKLITINFESMLDAIESRLISVRYADHKQGETKKIAGFGVLGHFYNFNHLEKCLKMMNPDFKMPSREFLSSLFNITPSFKMYDMKDFRSATGDTTDGCFIVCTFIPDMIARDMYAVYSKVVRACRVAEKCGVGIVTLGGFTSIVGERLGHQIDREVDIPITTGNTYTAVLIVESIERAAQTLGRELKDLKIAIIGGTGDIGSACARALSMKAKQVTITGRTRAHLRKLRAELKRNKKAAIEATSDNEKAVRSADVVIAVASASSSILSIDWFKPGAIICDAAYPKNVSHTATDRRDIFIFSGGLANIPTPITTGVDMGLPSESVSYGCFSEVIILALERRYENFSYGRGNITLDKMQEIYNIGKRHGFEVAPFYWGDRLIEKD
ncbi:MAG: SRPBCC family protein, partial [Candidatus Omnitrophota bacterium]